MTSDLQDLVDAGFDEMVDIRRALHCHPELSFEEHDTTALIHERLGALGLEQVRCPTETGAVYALDGGRTGATVLVRADIDALPIHEATDRPWTSTSAGVMHACGHDAHTAITVGVATALAQRAEDLPGRFVFLFQPGEEHVEGARRMLDGDLLDRIRPDRMLACHVASILPTGAISVRPDVALAGVAEFSIRAGGSGGHAALDGGQGSPLSAIARIVTELGGLLADLEHEGVAAVASAGRLAAGTAFNVVPIDAEVSGALRTFSPTQARVARERLGELCRRVAADEGVEVELHFSASTGPVVNDRATAEVVDATARQILGRDAVVPLPPVTAGDDCAEFLARTPGCYFFVGAAPADGAVHLHHSPTFDIDERSLHHGAAVMAGAAVTLAGGVPAAPGAA